MARNIAEIVKEMRNSPPRKADDPRFDELDQLAADMGGEELGEGELPPGEGEMPMEGEAPAPEMTPEEQDAAMMDEAMGGPAGAPASPEGIPPDAATPEEDMLANDGAPGVSSKMKRPNALMKKKKSSYLAGL